jgi:non-heme chloroperoxidase
VGRLEVEGGKEIHFDHYPGTGAPLLLVHGWATGGRCWDLTLPALLAAGHEVVVVDLRCTGRSDRDFDDVSIDACGGDLAALVKVTHLAEPVLVGWSVGAAVAVAGAGAIGDALAGLCLVSPATPRFVQGDAFPYGLTAELLEDTIGALRRSRPDFLHALAEALCQREVGPNTVEWLWQLLMEASPRVDDALADLGHVDQRSSLTAVKAPALVIGGSHDTIVDPEIHRVCSDLLANSKFLEFVGSGHAPFIEDSARFERELLAFAADPAGSVLAPGPAEAATFAPLRAPSAD